MLGALGLLVAAAVAYAPAYRAGFIWDDDRHVTENDTLRSLQGLARIWFAPGAAPQYYPVVHTTFWIEYHLWGLNPAGYHVVNVLFHGLNSVLVWRLLRRLGVPAAGVVAAIFGLHPVHVESVAWVSEHKNTISGLFYLTAILAYLRFRPLEESGAAPRNAWRWYAVALICCVAATLSKSVTLTLAPALLVITWWKHRRLAWRDVRPLIPFVVLAVAVCPFSMKLESGFVGGEHYAPGDWRLSGLERVLIAGRGLWFYAAKLVWPTGLAFSYDRWTIDGTVWWQYAFPVGAVLAFALALALRPRWGAGPAAALMLFAGTLAPALGFVNYYPMRYSYVADHFQYLASIALLALFVTGALAVGRRLGTIARRAAPAAVATLLLVLGVGTWQRSSVYKDQETLWRDTLAKRPNSFIALNNLGDELYRQRRSAEAIPFLARALRVRPDSREIITNLANAYGTLGRNAEALQLQLAWLEKNPDDAVLHHNAAVTYYFGLHQPAEAMEHVGRALALVPDYAAARQLLRVMQSAGVTSTSSAPAAR